MQYTPAIPPQKEEDLLPYLNEEFVRVAQSFNNLESGYWTINYNMPSKLKPGLIKYFDGSNANPLGSGKEGLYFYGLDNGWHYLGLDGTGTGYVSSVNGQTGDVTLDAADVGADPVGTAASAIAAHEAAPNPHPQYVLKVDEGLDTITFPTTISAMQFIANNGSSLVLADRTVPSHALQVIGMSTTAAAGGGTIKVLTQGYFTDPTLGLSLGPVWLDTAGFMTQTRPTSGFLLQVGKVVSPTELVVDIGTPIILA